MIEKLKVVLKPEDWNLPVNELERRCLKNLLLKIDELVDVANNQQIQLNNHECRLLDLHSRITALDDPTYHEAEPEPAENVQDKFAEQRKWIGKLCWFWDIQEEYKFVGILGEVADNGTYFLRDGIVSYLNCEPVKPDDDSIYKGE